MGPAMGGAFGTTIAGLKVFEFDFIGGSDIENGQANATVGNAVLIERGFETVAVTKDINHYLLKSGDSLEIDVTAHFSGANLPFSATSSDGTPLAVCSAKLNESTRSNQVLTAQWVCGKAK